jgi:hypothetical protein
MSIGFDAGTYNLVVAKRAENGDVKYKKEINCFIELPLENRYLFNIMKKAKAPLIERDNVAYVVGQAAVNMACTLPKIELRRPMKEGCLNPKEKDAFNILRIMAHSLIGKISKDQEIVYYSVPANAINNDTDADYHQKILEQIFQKYQVDGKVLTPYPINEALAIIYAELEEKQYTGLSASCGSGMINFCYAIYGAEVSSFSIVNSGDWIDNQAAKATGESPAFINKEKMKIDLTVQPTNLIERAIHTQYRLMIEKTVSQMKKAIIEKESIKHPDEPLTMIVAGGTSGPNGFIDLFRKTLEEAKLPVPIGEIRRPDDYLYTVARGCLIAAEVSQE